MNGLLLLLLIILATYPLALFLRKKFSLVYTWPWRWLVDTITALAYSHDWRLFGDVAITIAVGPVLAWRVVEDRRRALFAFIVYTAAVFLFIPSFTGSVSPDIILPILFVTLFGFGGYALFLVGSSAATIVSGYLSGVHPAPGIGPALPGISIGGFKIPLFEGIIALVVALIFHEGAHGVVALREKIPVRRAGILTLGLLPVGAYVEPDEAVFRRSPPLSRMRVYAAGPMANLVVFLVAASVLVSLTPLASFLSEYACAHGAGVRILSVPETLDIGSKVIRSPAHGVLRAGDVIVEVNGEQVRCVTDFFKVLAPLQKNESNAVLHIAVLRSGELMDFNVHLNSGYMGIRGVEDVYASHLPWWYYVLSFLVSVIHWLAFLNLMIGLVNLLPIPPLDGGYLYADVLGEIGLRPLYRALLWATLVILAVNALPWFF